MYFNINFHPAVPPTLHPRWKSFRMFNLKYLYNAIIKTKNKIKYLDIQQCKKWQFFLSFFALFLFSNFQVNGEKIATAFFFGVCSKRNDRNIACNIIMNEAQKEQWRFFICKRPDEKKLLHLNDNVDWLQATADMFFGPCIYPHSKKWSSIICNWARVWLCQ